MNENKIRPKVAAGLYGGVSVSAILTLVSAITAEDWATAAQVFIVSILPVIISFALAWLKSDPEWMLLLERFKEELDANVPPPPTKL